MTPAQLIKDIGSGKFKPAYYLYGEEDFRKFEAVKHLLTNYIPQQQRTLNFVRFEVDRVEFEKICGELASIPMMGERKLILIDEPQRLSPEKLKRFAKLLTPPPPETVVILSTSADHTPRKDSAFFREITKIAEPVQFNRLDVDDARGRIARFLEKNSLVCEPEAVNLLVDITDGDFGGLAAELEKLAITKNQGDKIIVADVRAITSSYEDFSIFELIDLVAAHETDKAMRACDDLLQRGMTPPGVLGMLSRQMIDFLKAHRGKKLTGAPFYQSNVRRQAQGYAESEVIRAISLIAKAERDVRLSGIPQAIIMENLIREISR